VSRWPKASSKANQSPDDAGFDFARKSWLCHDLRRHPGFDFAVGKIKISLRESLILGSKVLPKTNLCPDDPGFAWMSW
jgi:hypothetical protein